MGLFLVEVYRSPNIGIFLKANDRFLLAPKGVAPSKAEKFAADLQISPIYTSVGGTRLLGPLVAMNNNGILVSRMIEDYEMREIASQTGMNVVRFASKYNAVGNLVAANDSGAIVSPILEPSAVSQVADVLGVEAHRMEIGDYIQIGVMIVPTNRGAAVYPKLTESEVQEVDGVFKVESYPTSVNGGVPFLSSGLVANSRHALVGNLTTGPELIFLTRALKV